MSPQNPRLMLAREAVRLHQRYQRELVERFSVCPWAKPARANGAIRTHVVVDRGCEPIALTDVVDAWAEDATAEVAFVIAPRFDADGEAFFDWAAGVGSLRPGVFLSAPFHPEPAPSTSTIHFLRRTPDPTVQLVRRTRLEQIRSQDQPHYADIFELSLSELQRDGAPRTVAASVLANNERLIAREGRALLQSIIDDIREDRDKTYATILPNL